VSSTRLPALRIAINDRFPLRSIDHLPIYLQKCLPTSRRRRVRRGSAAIDFFVVAAGRFDGFFFETGLDNGTSRRGCCLWKEGGGAITVQMTGTLYSTNARPQTV